MNLAQIVALLQGRFPEAKVSGLAERDGSCWIIRIQNTKADMRLVLPRPWALQREDLVSVVSSAVAELDGREMVRSAEIRAHPALIMAEMKNENTP